jgi:hypothetical protein
VSLGRCGAGGSAARELVKEEEKVSQRIAEAVQEVLGRTAGAVVGGGLNAWKPQTAEADSAEEAQLKGGEQVLDEAKPVVVNEQPMEKACSNGKGTGREIGTLLRVQA